MLRSKSDTDLATEYRRLRMQTRPLFNELKRRGYNISEVHGHSKVPVTTFENICISKPTVVKL